MSKLNLTTFASLQNDPTAVAELNSNSAAIVTALENTLSRDGTTPNQMLATVDMNSNRIINLAAPVSTSEPLRLADVSTLNGAGTITVSTLPVGGTVGNTLVKKSSTNFDTAWSPRPLRPEQFGAVGDGVANDTAALVSFFTAAKGLTAVLNPGSTYLTDPLVITTTNWPYKIIGNGATIKARASSASPLVTLQGIPATANNTFEWDGTVLNANSLHATGLKILGIQNSMLNNITVIAATGSGIWFAGSAGNGSYYNSWSNVHSNNNGAFGWFMNNTIADGQNYVASNTFTGCGATSNTSGGWSIDYASNCYVNCQAELNAGPGFTLNHTWSSSFMGGYTEGNLVATVDVSFSGNASNSFGVKIIGGRHLGNINNIAGNVNCVVNPDGYQGSSSQQWATYLNSDYLSTKGIALAGTAPVADGINSGANGISFLTSGSTKASIVNGLVVGSPTGGDLGNGTINATDVRINNSSIMTAAGTATLTNKTYDTAGTGNSFSINSVAVTANTGTGSVVRATSPTITTPTITGSLTATNLVTNSALSQMAANTIKGNNTGSTANAADLTVPQVQALVAAPYIIITATGVNFNSVADTALAFTLPTGFTRIKFVNLSVTHASASISTSVIGLFTATGGGGTNVISSGTVTVTSTSENTNNNAQGFLFSNLASTSYLPSGFGTANTLYFRPTTPQGSAATADVELIMQIAP